MPSNQDNKKSQSARIARIFNFVGGTLIFLGISYLLFNNWDMLGTIIRILVTLGLACWSLLFAVKLSKENKDSQGAAVFFTLGALLLPLGISVTLNAMLPHANADLFYILTTSDVSNIIITAICFLVFVLLQLRFPREILLLFCVFYGSLFFITASSYLNFNMNLLPVADMGSYQTLALGLCYLLLGYCVSFRDNELTGPLYFFGDIFILSASFHLGGYTLFYPSNTHVFWEIMSPVLVLLNFVLAIPLKSKSLLYIGAIFLVIFVSQITTKFAYLFGTLGWPLVLIAAGLFLMFLGYLFLQLHNRDSK